MGCGRPPSKQGPGARARPSEPTGNVHVDRGGRVGVEWEDLGGEEKLTIAFVDRRRQVGLLARKHGRIIYETLETF